MQQGKVQLYTSYFEWWWISTVTSCTIGPYNGTKARNYCYCWWRKSCTTFDEDVFPRAPSILTLWWSRTWNVWISEWLKSCTTSHVKPTLKLRGSQRKQLLLSYMTYSWWCRISAINSMTHNLWPCPLSWNCHFAASQSWIAISCTYKVFLRASGFLHTSPNILWHEIPWVVAHLHSWSYHPNAVNHVRRIYRQRWWQASVSHWETSQTFKQYHGISALVLPDRRTDPFCALVYMLGNWWQEPSAVQPVRTVSVCYFATTMHTNTPRNENHVRSNRRQLQT